MATTALKAFRQIDEYDTINGLFRFNPTGTYPTTCGNLVKIISGWKDDQRDTLLGPAGAAFSNTLSQNWGPPAFVGTVTNTGDAVIGMLAYDVKEVDENGIPLRYNPRKAAENNWTISGEACTIITRGVVLYSGVVGATTAGASAFAGGNGEIATSGTNNPNLSTSTKIGKFLGPKDDAGWVAVKLEL